MNKQELDLLERAFAAEIDGAISGGIRLLQTKSKVAKKLADEGYLEWGRFVLQGRFPVTIEGYRLTLKGNFTYCMSDRVEG